MPVISLNSNPSDVITSHNLGICCDGILENMIEEIRVFKPERYSNSVLCDYVEKNHNSIVNTKLIIKTINDL